MLLALGIMKTNPTELVITLRTFHLGASCFFLLEFNTALNVRTELGTVSEEKHIQSIFSYLVSLI